MTDAIEGIVIVRFDEGGDLSYHVIGDERVLTLYRDDSTSQVVFDRVKAWFWTAGSTVLVISRYDAETGPEHHYIHWPRERFCWFKDEPR